MLIVRKSKRCQHLLMFIHWNLKYLPSLSLWLQGTTNITYSSWKHCCHLFIKSLCLINHVFPKKEFLLKNKDRPRSTLGFLTFLSGFQYFLNKFPSIFFYNELFFSLAFPFLFCSHHCWILETPESILLNVFDCFVLTRAIWKAYQEERTCYGDISRSFPELMQYFSS